ncbi:MAG TPA: ABC transporter permease [Cyclobacteriaceae bacterium]|nr:ABC transporter permease [Cyclobacteriaceae bacterium]HRJ83302.1 ABC transporter permease [Cyclobacteriaceae bacterium]
MLVQETIIKKKSGWIAVDWRELFRYKDLLWFLTVRSIKAKYAQSILGVSWAVIQPLFSTLVYTIVFGNLARIDSNGVPYFLFSLVALVPWTFFSNTLNESANSLITNANLVTKVYFPRLVLPLSSVFSKGIDFLIGFMLLVVVLIINKQSPDYNLIWLPWLLVVLLMTSLGTGMLLSALAVQYRDVKYALTFLVQLLMYAAPVVYPTTNVPEVYRMWYALNPMVGVIEGFRSIFLQTMPFPYTWVIFGSTVSVILFFSGLFFFRKMERIFSDVA